MRSYQDIDTFSEWTPEERIQFALAVTKGLIMDMVAKPIPAIAADPCLQPILPRYFLPNI